MTKRNWMYLLLGAIIYHLLSTFMIFITLKAYSDYPLVLISKYEALLRQNVLVMVPGLASLFYLYIKSRKEGK